MAPYKRVGWCSSHSRAPRDKNKSSPDSKQTWEVPQDRYLHFQKKKTHLPGKLWAPEQFNDKIRRPSPQISHITTLAHTKHTVYVRHWAKMDWNQTACFGQQFHLIGEVRPSKTSHYFMQRPWSPHLLKLQKTSLCKMYSNVVGFQSQVGQTSSDVDFPLFCDASFRDFLWNHLSVIAQ